MGINYIVQESYIFTIVQGFH